MKPRIAARIARLLVGASLAAPLATQAQYPSGWPAEGPPQAPGSGPPVPGWVPQQIGSPGSPTSWSPGDAGYLHASHMIGARVHEILCEEPYSYGPCR